jgi:hypothetical protein
MADYFLPAPSIRFGATQPRAQVTFSTNSDSDYIYSETHFMTDRKRLHRILSICIVLLSSTAMSSNTARPRDSAIAEMDGAVSTSTMVRHHQPPDVEIRFEFYPTTAYDDSVAPTFMVVGQDGHAQALRFQLRDQSRNIASYEGVLPRPEVQRLFARVSAAIRLPKYRQDYDPKLIYESDSFYLALKQQASRVEEISGGLETRPDEVRSLITDIREVWKQLQEVQPAYAYLSSRPIDKDRLRLLKRKKDYLTPITSLPVSLQLLLIPAVRQPRNFYPLTQEQYDQLKARKLSVVYKGLGYELILIPSSKETKP